MWTAWKKIKTPSGKLLTLSQEPLTQISIRMRERQRGIISHQLVLLGVSCYHWALILRDDVKQHDHWPNTTVGIKMSACVCGRGNCAAALWGDWTERERERERERDREREKERERESNTAVQNPQSRFTRALHTRLFTTTSRPQVTSCMHLWMNELGKCKQMKRKRATKEWERVGVMGLLHTERCFDRGASTCWNTLHPSLFLSLSPSLTLSLSLKECSLVLD